MSKFSRNRFSSTGVPLAGRDREQLAGMFMGARRLPSVMHKVASCAGSMGSPRSSRCFGDGIESTPPDGDGVLIRPLGVVYFSVAGGYATFHLSPR
jgi:hypothetical protein